MRRDEIVSVIFPDRSVDRGKLAGKLP